MAKAEVKVAKGAAGPAEGILPAQGIRARIAADEIKLSEPLLANQPWHVVPWDGAPPPVRRGDPRNTWGFDMEPPPQR